MRKNPRKISATPLRLSQTVACILGEGGVVRQGYRGSKFRCIQRYNVTATRLSGCAETIPVPIRIGTRYSIFWNTEKYRSKILALGFVEYRKIPENIPEKYRNCFRATVVYNTALKGLTSFRTALPFWETNYLEL